MRSLLFLALLAATALTPAFAAADEGKRVFTTPLQFEDADVEDDWVVPNIRYMENNEDGRAAGSTSYFTEFTKRMTENFALSVEGTYVDQSAGAGGENAFGGAGIGFKYGLYENPDSETKVTFGGDWDIGGTASHRIEPHSFSTVTPWLFFSQGLGGMTAKAHNLPQWLQPGAVTGAVGVAVPSRGWDNVLDEDTGLIERERNQTVLQYAFSLQYDLNYMDKYTDYKIPAFFNQLAPIVEFVFETPLNGEDRTTTGTINPGVAWRNEDGIDIGIEAAFPINSETGSGVGVTAQFRTPLEVITPLLAEPLFDFKNIES